MLSPHRLNKLSYLLVTMTNSILIIFIIGLVIASMISYRIDKLEAELLQIQLLLANVVKCTNSLVPWNRPDCIQESRNIAKLMS
jgi:hypothetical protein